MNHVVVKLRMRGKENKYRKILSDKTLYRLPDDIENRVEYSPEHNLDEDAWFAVSEFSQKEYCLPLLLDKFVSGEYDLFNKADFDKLDYLFSYQDNNLYYFQQISKVHLLSRKNISIGDSVEFHESSREIAIKELPDALYKKDEDILYFKKLSSITGIFKGIDSLYREATEGETEGFLKNAFIKLENEFSANHVKSANRKRIAIAVDTMKNCSEKKKTVILDSIKDYCPDLVVADNKFKITSETDLKMILYGVGQRFYTTPDGEEKRIANSIIKLE